MREHYYDHDDEEEAAAHFSVVKFVAVMLVAFGIGLVVLAAAVLIIERMQ